MAHIFLFDLDQTLLNFHASEYKALGIVLRENGLTFNDDIYNSFKTCNKSLWLELEKQTITRTELFIKRFNYVIELAGGDTSKLDALKINNDFINTMAVNGVLMDGALEFVKKLKSEIHDAKIYIITNGATVNAKGRIESTGLDKFIDGLFVSEDMGISKPAPEYFDIVLKKIDEPKESCIVIGDSLSSDMLGAKNAGLCSVWFMPTGDDVEGSMREYDIDFTARDFSELFDVLKNHPNFHKF